MASLSLLTLVTILLSFCKPPQVIAATCSDFGQLEACDDNCNEMGACSSDGILTSSQNCQANKQICLNNKCSDPGTNPSYCGNGIVENVECLFGYDKYVPSLSDCSTYYACSMGSRAIPNKCVGSSFDPITRQCGGPLTNGRCTNFFPTECTAGMTGTLVSTDTLGFQCAGSGSNCVVRWTVCNPGGHYSSRNRSCVDTGVLASSLCPTSVPGTLAIPSTTCSFIKCYGRNDFEVIECFPGYHYSQADRGCIYGGCLRIFTANNNIK